MILKDRDGLRLMLLGALLAVAVAICLSDFHSFQLGTYMDDAQYVVLARSLVEGRDYGLITPPGQILPTRYPFGWPLLLAPVWWLSGGGLPVLPWVSLALTVACAVLIAVTGQALGLAYEWVGFGAAGLYALSPLAIGHARMAMSEPAFLAFVLLGLTATARSEARGRQGHFWSVVLGCAWLMATYTRTVGASLVVACGAYLLVRRRYRSLGLAVAGSLLTALAVVSFTAVDWHDLVNIAEYRKQFSDPVAWGQNVDIDPVARGLEGGAAYLGTYLRDALVPFVGSPSVRGPLGRLGLGFVPSIVALTVAGLAMFGYAASFRRVGLRPAHLYVPLYAAVTVVWPWRGERFLYGVLPLTYAYMLVGAYTICRVARARVPALHTRLRLDAVGTVLLVLLAGANATASLRIEGSRGHAYDLGAGTTWIRDFTPLGAVVLAEQPDIAYLYSGRHSVSLSDSVAAIRQQACAANTYVLIAPKLEWAPSGSRSYSRTTASTLAAIERGELPADLAYEDYTVGVAVWALRCTG